MSPPNAGNPLAIAIPKQRGSAMRDTNSPEVISFRRFSLRPFTPSEGTGDDTGVKAAERFIITTPKNFNFES